MRTSPFCAAKRKQHDDSFSTVMFNHGRRNTGLLLKFKDLLSMIMFLNEEVTYTRKVSASRDPVLDNRKKDRLKPVP